MKFISGWFGGALIAVLALGTAWNLINVIYARTGSVIADQSVGRIYQVSVNKYNNITGTYSSFTVFVDRWHAVAYRIVTMSIYLLGAFAIVTCLMVAVKASRQKRRRQFEL